jgi:hypothetical protein
MSSADRYRLIWSIVLLTVIVALYLADAPETLIGSLFTLFPRDSHDPRGDRGARGPAEGS